MSAKMLAAVVIALVAGLVLGRVGPQAELRTAQKRIESLRKDLSSRTGPGVGGTMTGVRSMLNVSRKDIAAGAKARRVRDTAPAATNAGDTAGAEAAAGLAPDATQGTARVERDAAYSNTVQRMKDAWALRAELARTNFIARAKLDTRQTLDLDILVEAMNLRLGSAVDRWAARIREDGDLSSETGLRMMNELSSAVVLTYDEMDRKMPADWRANAGKRFELVTFIDPEVLTPLQDLEGVMNKRPARHRHDDDELLDETQETDG